MSFKRYVGSVGLTLLLCRSLYPCSYVMIGGFSPTDVRQVSGTIVGSGRVALMGNGHDDERKSTKVVGASISIKRRKDIEFFKNDEVQYPPGEKPSSGNLRKWECEIEVSTVQSDESGNFAFAKLKPGKYCLDITGPQTKDDNQVAMRGSFIINVVVSAPKIKLIADISPSWPDCSGGSSLQLKPFD